MSNEKSEKKEEVKLSLGPRLLELLAKLQQIELEDFEMEVENLEIALPSTAIMRAMPKAAAPAPPVVVKEKPKELIIEEFTPPVEEYPGKVREVTLGATRSEGGSRSKTIVIGGATTPAFYMFEKPPTHPPTVSIDIFDMKVPLPKALRMHVQEVMDDPAEWAKMGVSKFGADLVTIHLVSTDPLIKDTPPAEAVKTVEEILQAVDTPIIVGGCGDPKKDAEVFKKIAEVAQGERVMLSSLTLDMAEAGTIAEPAKAASEFGHVVLAFTALDLNTAKELNRRLYEFLPEDSIVMDLTTAALGYGLEYSFTIHERARLAALLGDPELQHPVLSGSTNAWAARESWMKLGPEYEPRELRGPLWETITALSLLLAGVDMFMMMHPAAVRTMKEVINKLLNYGKAKPENLADWVTVRI